MPTNDHSQSPNAEEKDTDPRHNSPSPPVLPKKKIRKGTNKRALESSDDDDPSSQAPSHSLPVQPQKKVQLRTGTKKNNMTLLMMQPSTIILKTRRLLPVSQRSPSPKKQQAMKTVTLIQSLRSSKILKKVLKKNSVCESTV